VHNVTQILCRVYFNAHTTFQFFKYVEGHNECSFEFLNVVLLNMVLIHVANFFFNLDEVKIVHSLKFNFFKYHPELEINYYK